MTADTAAGERRVTETQKEIEIIRVTKFSTKNVKPTPPVTTKTADFRIASTPFFHYHRKRLAQNNCTRYKEYCHLKKQGAKPNLFTSNSLISDDNALEIILVNKECIFETVRPRCDNCIDTRDIVSTRCQNVEEFLEM